MAVSLTTTELALRFQAIVGSDGVLSGTTAAYLVDATDSRGIRGEAMLVVLPGSTEEVASVMACCYEHGIPIVPRGGGTGFAGGAVPGPGAVVVSLERLRAVRAIEPLQWRMHVEAGLPTAEVQRLARENGLYFPPDPGASEQSQIGGNLATNAGGPHAFKYGVTGRWVTGLEVVVPPGNVIQIGGPVRKDVAGFDLRDLMIGSEGALGIITAAWLRLVPLPESRLPVIATYPSASSGCEAIACVMGSGLEPSVLEYVDAEAVTAAGASLPATLEPGFMVIVEADGPSACAAALRRELMEALDVGASSLAAPTEPDEIAALWRWRDGVSFAVTGRLGHKLSEDVSVPVDRLPDIIEATLVIGERHGVPACSWGHAGDGNVHSSFLFAPDDALARGRAEAAAAELIAAAVGLGGTVSGEHGIGLTKLRHLHAHGDPGVLDLQRQIKGLFDPKGLLNPGKAV
ncbi:MAG: FAD-linked oxidase C-terminal domain-containing protein [Solirubrobacteraceae bacterium]